MRSTFTVLTTPNQRRHHGNYNSKKIAELLKRWTRMNEHFYHYLSISGPLMSQGGGLRSCFIMDFHFLRWEKGSFPFNCECLSTPQLCACYTAHSELPNLCNQHRTSRGKDFIRTTKQNGGVETGPVHINASLQMNFQCFI